MNLFSHSIGALLWEFSMLCRTFWSNVFLFVCFYFLYLCFWCETQEFYIKTIVMKLYLPPLLLQFEVSHTSIYFILILCIIWEKGPVSCGYVVCPVCSISCMWVCYFLSIICWKVNPSLSLCSWHLYWWTDCISG